MKTRTKPKVICYYQIGKEKIGFIQLVSYIRGKSPPHIEYEINEKYRNQGIMSRHLPKFLKECKKREYYQLIAIVKKGNLQSIKLLEKNEFLRISETDEEHVYIIDLRLTKTVSEEIVKMTKEKFNIKW